MTAPPFINTTAREDDETITKKSIRMQILKDTATSIPWAGVAGGIFWGACTIVCAAVAVNLFAIGGIYGICGGIIYLGFTGCSLYCVISSLKSNQFI